MAFAGPHVIGNGGDGNEIRFKDIATNIEQWIETDQAEVLKLPANLSFADYKSRLLNVMKSYSISFTDLPVKVYGAEKTCRNTIETRTILCNSARFERLVEKDLSGAYQLVHHEVAGLAGIETNTGANSDYRISSQISGSLYQETVTRLPVLNTGDLQLTRKPLCLALAYRALKQRTRARTDQITFLGGTIVGDGGAVVEVDIFTVTAGKLAQNGSYTPTKQDGAYKIEFFNDQGDGCELKVSDARITRID